MICCDKFEKKNIKRIFNKFDVILVKLTMESICRTEDPQK